MPLFNPGGVTADATLTSKGKQRLITLNLADYPGADPSGSTDSYAAWLLARADAIALAVGGFAPGDGGSANTPGVKIYFAPGTWKFTQPLTLPKANINTGLYLVLANVIWLEGAGSERTIITTDDNSAGHFGAGTATITWDISTPSVRAYNQRISHMTVRAPAVAGTYAIRYQLSSAQPNAALYQAERLEITMEDVIASGSNQFHTDLIWLEGSCWNSRFSYVQSAVHNLSGNANNVNIKPTRLLKTEAYHRSGARCNVTVSTAGVITAITPLTDDWGNTGGYGYTGSPTVAIYGTGTGATATATQSGGSVNAITVTAGGTGYDATTYAVISGGGTENSADPGHSTDFPGVAYSHFHHIAAVRYGSGFPMVLSGRFMESEFRYIFCNGGYAGSVNYDWINCASTKIINPGSEGGLEAVQHRFYGCASMTLETPTNGAGANAVPGGLTWAVGTAVVVGQFTRPTAGKLSANVANNYIFRCTTAGTTHASTEPDWTTAASPSTGSAGTVSDNGVVWTNTGYPASPNCYEFRGRSHHITINHRDVAAGAVTVNGRNIAARLFLVDSSSYDIYAPGLQLTASSSNVYATASASLGEILDLGTNDWFQGMDMAPGNPGSRFQFGTSPYAVPSSVAVMNIPLIAPQNSGSTAAFSGTMTTAQIISAPVEFTATRYRWIVDLTGKTSVLLAIGALSVGGIAATTQLFAALQWCPLVANQIPSVPTWKYLDNSTSSGAGAVDLFTALNYTLGVSAALTAAARTQVGLRLVVYDDGVHTPTANTPSILTAQLLAS